MFNESFYPTPKRIISKMVAKIKGNNLKILESSAGKGDIVEYIQKVYRNNVDIKAIEIDPDLRATLIGKKIKVIDTDFLKYSGKDRFDVIIANPPFKDGDKHLLKAIEIMYSGQIIFLLNAETIKNPYSNYRKYIIKLLDEFNADIEFLNNAFIDAERKTNVDVALISFNIKRSPEEYIDDLFNKCNDSKEQFRIDENIFDNEYELSTGNAIDELVAEYNQIINIGIKTIVEFYRNYPKIGNYLDIVIDSGDYNYGYEDMIHIINHRINNFIQKVREDYWYKVLNIKEVNNRLTDQQRNKFREFLNTHDSMDFTGNNIRQFILNIINSFDRTIINAIVEIFDLFTIKHSFSDTLYEKNIHYFNGWKTNKAYKVNKKVIIPFYGDSVFSSIYSGRLNLPYNIKNRLNDIDIVMSYFDGMKSDYVRMSYIIEEAFRDGISRNIESEYFIITCYKKGTIHLTFKDEDILRNFNVIACKEKKWLPDDYGMRQYNEIEYKDVVDSFEGKESYSRNVGIPIFKNNNILKISGGNNESNISTKR